MTQQSGNQFDDDLTVGMDDDGSFSTDSIDLFEFTGDEESPIARLKTIILSIDWEINDDILQQLDDELVDLGDIWAGDKIKQIYIQGLNKIGKYIYKEKANAHPNAINLLITFYHNLEKIVAAGDSMSEEEKKELLLQDVKKFDQLKSHIGKSESSPAGDSASGPVAGLSESDDQEGELKSLKALVLGIDWEISEEGLQKLSDEVQRLEGVFSQNKAKLILLQGIGALSSYINKMRSRSNGKVFPLLHSFYDVLEKISSKELPAAEEKQLLLAEVEKFNTFKEEIALAKSQTAASAGHVSVVPESEPEKAVDEKENEILPVDEGEEELQVASDVDSRLASVFGDDESDIEALADKDVALAGVNVETDADDDSDEEALPYQDGAVAPALAEADQESSFSVEKLAEELAEPVGVDEGDDLTADDAPLPPGVDVETEADDDSDEEELPFEDGEIAPALSANVGEQGFDEESLTTEFGEDDTDDLDDRLDSFFDDEVESSSLEWESYEMSGSQDESERIDDSELAVALSDSDEDSPSSESSVTAFSDDGEALKDVIEELAAREVVEDGAGGKPEPSLLDEELPSEAGDDVLEDAIEDKLSSFFDDDVPSPVAEEADEDEPETILQDEEDSSDIDIEDEDPTGGHLAFLDEDIAHPDQGEGPETPIVETSDHDLEEQSGERVSALDDDTDFDEEALVPSDEEEDSFLAEAPVEEHEEAVFSEDTIEAHEETVVFEEAMEEPVDTILDEKSEKLVSEETLETALAAETFETVFEESKDDEEDDAGPLSFLDEEEGLHSAEGELSQESESDEDIDETADLFEDEEIEFTLPGEITQEIVSEFVDEPDFSQDDEIDFMVPGEKDEVQDAGFDISGAQQEEVVFEVVADDVEIDPLPGEEYADEPELQEESEQDMTDVMAGDAQSVDVDYRYLSLCIDNLHKDISEESLQALLAEINRMRGRSSSHNTGKIFLQMLSTICQQHPGTIDTSEGGDLDLVDDVFFGYKMNSSPDVSSDQVQEHLLRCTSQVLLMQQGKCRKPQGQNIGLDTAQNHQYSSATVVSDFISEDDEKLKAFVREELADIKRLFLEEIKSLRKEFAGK